jgi:hypothetical protein
MRHSVTIVLAIFVFAVGASAAVAQPLVLPHTAFRAGKLAALEVVAPGTARSCTISIRDAGRLVLHRHVPLGGPTRLVRWRVGKTARGTWRTVFSCYGRGGTALGSDRSTVTIRADGRARGHLIQLGTVRVRHGSIPEMSAPSAYAALSNPLVNDDVTINACSGGAVVGCFNPCADSQEIKSTRTTGDGTGTAVQVEPTGAARRNVVGDLLSVAYSDAALSEDFGLYREMWRDLNRCANLPGNLTASERHSLYEQMACHAFFGVVSGAGGNTWDFEAWHRNVDWSDALTISGRCGQGYGEVPVAAAGLQGKLVRAFDTHASSLAPQTWLVDNLNGIGLRRELASSQGLGCLTAKGKDTPHWYPSGFLDKYLGTNGAVVRDAEACGTAGADPAAPATSEANRPPPDRTPPPASAPTPTSPSPVDRTAVTSYDRVAPSAPHHGYFDFAYQAFTAQSNTITQLGVTVGSQSPVPGAQVEIRLCATQPDNHGNCQVLGRTTPQIVNYGGTYGDIGDIAVDPGQTYWIDYLQPSAGAGSWVTYWWAGGSSISTSDQMQASAKGYNK